MEKKNITKKDRQELAKAITESKEFNDFIKVIAKDVRSKSCEYLKHHPNKNKSHDCNELVPFRWKHFLISALDNQRFCYELDPRVKGKRHSQDKIHFKLYYDIVEWFWNNADEVLDYKEDYPRLKVTKKIKSCFQNR